MCKFIYVFSKEAYNTLIKCGYEAVKTDCEKNIYVFENKDEINFSLSKSEFVLSDIMAF